MTDEEKQPEEEQMSEEQQAAQTNFLREVETLRLSVAKLMMPKLYRFTPEVASKKAFAYADAFIQQMFKG